MGELMQRERQTAVAQYQESKELSEIKGKMYLARQFPRDPDWSLQSVLRECQRKDLAEVAQYEFPKGDSVVKGPSIRLVEVLARHWGNITSGVDEIESKEGETTIKSYAWDLETNVSDAKTFTVKHERTAGKGQNRKTYKLTDERDVYEMVANKGARRKRACLLAVLPGWYVDAAVAACEETLKQSLTDGKSMEDVISAAVSAFAEFGISPAQIEEKIGKEIKNLSKNDVVKLRHLYSAIKDGFVKPADAFGLPPEPDKEVPSDTEAEALDALNARLTGGVTSDSDQG